MYNAEPAKLEEYCSLVGSSFENNVSKKELYDGYEFNKLTFCGTPLVIAGMSRVCHQALGEVLYMCFVISKEATNHLRALLIVGKDFLNFYTKQSPVCVMVEHNNNKFCKFAEHFGFERTNFVEKNEESDIIYDVYIRR